MEPFGCAHRDFEVRMLLIQSINTNHSSRSIDRKDLGGRELLERFELRHIEGSCALKFPLKMCIKSEFHTNGNGR